MILVFFKCHAIGSPDLMRCKRIALIPVEHKYYDKTYFTACGGYRNFVEYKGLTIDERMSKALELAKLEPGMNVLDIGCGRGEIVLHCALRRTKICGIDFSKDALKLANNLIDLYPISSKGADLIRADVKKIPFKNNLFDRIFLLDIIEHLHDYELNEMFQNIRTILKMDGLIIIHTSPNKWYYNYGYQIIRIVIFLVARVIIKKDIRSYYEKTMHVNEQSSKTLHKILKKHGLKFNICFSDFYHPKFFVLEHIGNKKLKDMICSIIESRFFQMLFCKSIYAIAWKTLRHADSDHIKNAVKNLDKIGELAYSPTSIEDTIKDILDDHIDMGVNDIGNLGRGWYHLENWPPTIKIRWTTKKAVAYLKSYKNGNILKMKFFTNAALEISVFVNNRLIKKEISEKGMWQTFEGKIEDDGLLEIKIELNKTWIPNEILHSGDKRELGIAVEKIWVCSSCVKESDLPLKTKKENIFELPFEPYGLKDTERCIEIPWTISCYKGEKKVLDIGYANAEERYLKELISLNISKLYGIDIVKNDVKGIITISGDIRKTNLPNNFFDLVFCVSTIEHIGRDNTVYAKTYCENDDLGDFKAIKEIHRITKKGGRIVLTAPYGKFHDYGWFIQYDDGRWNELIRASKCKKLREDFLIYKNGWYNSNKHELKDILYGDNNAPAAAGLVCVLLEKK